MRYKLVDLPGTYSLLSASQDEEVARDFILFGQPDCTIVVTDATCLERNLNLVLQVLEITDKVVVCVNLMDEARRKGIEVDVRSLSRDLGVPAIPTVARTGEGLRNSDRRHGRRRRGQDRHHAAPHRAPAETISAPWMHSLPHDRRAGAGSAQRALGGDAPARRRCAGAAGAGERRAGGDRRAATARRTPRRVARSHWRERNERWRAQARTHRANDGAVARPTALRRHLSAGFRDQLVQSLYADAESIARRAVRSGSARHWDWDQTASIASSPRRSSGCRSCCCFWPWCSGSP